MSVIEKHDRQVKKVTRRNACDNGIVDTSNIVFDVLIDGKPIQLLHYRSE